jgi:hypothetical protein
MGGKLVASVAPAANSITIALYLAAALRQVLAAQTENPSLPPPGGVGRVHRSSFPSRLVFRSQCQANANA